MAILQVSDDPVVSADRGAPWTSVVDMAMTRVVDQTLGKIMSWYGSERGFTCQMIREVFASLRLPSGLGQVRP